MRRLAHPALYKTSITGVIVLSNEIIIDIILICVWHTISSLKWPRSFTLHSLVPRQQELSCDLSNQRTNGPVNAHMISWPSKNIHVQNLENIW